MILELDSGISKSTVGASRVVLRQADEKLRFILRCLGMVVLWSPLIPADPSVAEELRSGPLAGGAAGGL